MDRKEADKRIDELKTSISRAEAVLISLESQLEAKPELRHGDYGIWDFDNRNYYVHAIFLEFPNDIVSKYSNDTKSGMFYSKESKTSATWCSMPEKNGKFIKFGNIFDDLAALSKPLDSFIVDGFHVYIIHKDSIVFGGKKMNKENVTEIWKQTGRILHTLKAEGGKR